MRAKWFTAMLVLLVLVGFGRLMIYSAHSSSIERRPQRPCFSLQSARLKKGSGCGRLARR